MYREYRALPIFFVICNGYNEKQNQAICNEILERLEKEAHLSPSHIEGYQHAEWILIDYLDFVVHIFRRVPASSINWKNSGVTESSLNLRHCRSDVQAHE